MRKLSEVEVQVVREAPNVREYSEHSELLALHTPHVGSGEEQLPEIVALKLPLWIHGCDDLEQCPMVGATQKTTVRFQRHIFEGRASNSGLEIKGLEANEGALRFAPISCTDPVPGGQGRDEVERPAPDSHFCQRNSGQRPAHERGDTHYITARVFQTVLSTQLPAPRVPR